MQFLAVPEKSSASSMTVEDTSDAVLCRICEEQVKADRIQAHLPICSVTHRFEIEQHNLEIRMRKILFDIVAKKKNRKSSKFTPT